MAKIILTIDDSRSIRDMVTFTLEPEGYQVVGAPEGATGLELLRAHRPAMVITDLNMPIMNGIEFIERARKEACGSGIPILMLTKESAPEMKEKGKNAGATGWLNKPFDADKLVAITKKLVG